MGAPASYASAEVHVTLDGYALVLRDPGVQGQACYFHFRDSFGWLKLGRFLQGNAGGSSAAAGAGCGANCLAAGLAALGERERPVASAPRRLRRRASQSQSLAPKTARSCSPFRLGPNRLAPSLLDRPLGHFCGFHRELNRPKGCLLQARLVRNASYTNWIDSEQGFTAGAFVVASLTLPRPCSCHPLTGGDFN